MRRAMPPARGATQIFCAYAKPICVALTVGVRSKRVPFEVCALVSMKKLELARLAKRKTTVANTIKKTGKRRTNFACWLRCGMNCPPENTARFAEHLFSMKRGREQRLQYLIKPLMNTDFHRSEKSGLHLCQSVSICGCILIVQLHHRGE